MKIYNEVNLGHVPVKVYSDSKLGRLVKNIAQVFGSVVKIHVKVDGKERTYNIKKTELKKAIYSSIRHENPWINVKDLKKIFKKEGLKVYHKDLSFAENVKSAEFNVCKRIYYDLFSSNKKDDLESLFRKSIEKEPNVSELIEIMVNHGNRKHVKELLFQLERNPYASKSTRAFGDEISKRIMKNPSAKVQALRQEKKENPSLKNDPDHRLKRKVAKSRAANVLVSTGKGQHGSQFVKAGDKKIAVFKPIHKEKSLMKKLFRPFLQKHYLNKGAMADAAAERASYLLAKELNNPYLTVPPVKILKLDNKKGSLAVFEKKGRPADEVLPEIEKKESYTKEELHIFQSFILFDYLLGNLDRHEENWLIDWDGETIHGIYPIDNGAAFPTQKPHSVNLFAAQNVYKWKRLKLAGIPFTPEMRTYIEKTVTNETLQRIIDQINEDKQIRGCYPENKHFLSEKSRTEFEFRALKLRQLLVDDPNLTPRQLAHY